MNSKPEFKIIQGPCRDDFPNHQSPFRTSPCRTKKNRCFCCETCRDAVKKTLIIPGSCCKKAGLGLAKDIKLSCPIGSMYAMYGNIYHQYTPFMLAYIPYMDPMCV